MPKGIADEIEDDRINRPALYKHKWLGEPSTTELKIYKDWAIVDELPHEARLERYGGDYGYSINPSVIVGIYYYNGGYIFDEVVYQKGLANKDIADILKNQERQVPFAPDSAEPKSNDEIRSYGITVLDVPKGKDSVRQGIQWVQSQRCSITKRSGNLIDSYKNFLWMTDKDGKVLSPNTYNHYKSDGMMAIMYGMQTLRPQDPVVQIKQEQMFNRNLNSRQINSSR